MFWRFGGYANISTIDTLLDKPDVTLEEVLEESDLIQELKQHNSKLIEYLREESVLQRLLAYVIAAPLLDPDEELEDDDDDESDDEDFRKSFSPIRSLSAARRREQPRTKEQEERRERRDKEKQRQRTAFVAAEILSSETWSIVEALMENQGFLRQFWEYIRKDAPLDPATASYFSKINETLLDKKTEEMLAFIKSLPNIVPAILQHVDCPMVLDLLLKIISMEKSDGGQGTVDWLESEDLMPSLLSFLSDKRPTFTQTSAGDFIKAIITISANASQNEQSCIGPNSLTRQLVSEPCIESLIENMLKGGNPLTVGVGIIIEVIRKNNSDYDPEIQAGQDYPPTTGDPIYLGTLLRLFAKHVPQFMELILSPNHTVLQGEQSVSIKRRSLAIASGVSIEPLGFDRFKTCELMAELLHCSNMGLLNERGSEDYIQQRDVERERLRAEGFLGRQQEPQSAVTEFSEDASSFHATADEDSPSSARKLEVTNSAEDDGFEDVGASGDIDGEQDEDAGEGPKPIKQSKSRLSLEDEFFDEPLDKSSSEPAKSPETSKRNSGQDLGSPRTAVAAQIEGLNIKKDEPKEESSEESSSSAADDLVSAIDAQLTPSASESGQSQDRPITTSPGVVSPNPDDAPAPLFSKPKESTASETEASAAEEQPEQALLEGDQQQEEQPAEQHFVLELENDVDGKPIVGDYLKMQFVEYKVVPTILDFFFRFPWNNFLHNVVYDVVQQVFNGPMDRGYNRNLAFDLFESGRVTERVIEGQRRSDDEQARSNLRLGYMGHLTLVAEEVVKFSERNPPEMLSEGVMQRVTDKAWCEYVEVTLNETRERDNAILGGVRPDMAVGPRQAVLNAVNAAQGFGPSAALAGAGLNGGGGGGQGLDSMDLSGAGGSGGFLSGGSLLSGFGSSSDEEDEEMDEAAVGGDEGEGGAGHNEQNRPSALSVFSSNPGVHEAASAGASSEASIPPPLNIPPSRARRQLAARLAMNAKNAQAERAAGEGELDPASPASEDGSPTPGSSAEGAEDRPAAAAGPTRSLDELLSAASRVPPELAADAVLQAADAGDGPWARLDREKPALQPAWQPRPGSGNGDWEDLEASSGSSDDEDPAWSPRNPNQGAEMDVPLRISDSPRTRGSK